MTARPPRPRAGFTLTEALVALAVLAAAGVLVAQLATWSLAERARTDARLEAVDAAANVLEQARARPWADLTADWAAAARAPDYLTARWPDGRLAVRVEPEPDRPRVKRVTVEFKWTDTARVGWPPVVLTGWFADRAAGGKP